MANSPAEQSIAIDLNRGVRMSKDPVSQLEVYMYFDEPGVYLTPQGKTVPEEIAARAGYDIYDYGKQKSKEDKLTEFQRMLDQEYGDSSEKTVIEERGGYQLVEVGTLGYVQVLDEDGNSMVIAPLPKDIGTELFNKMAPLPKVEKPAKGKVKNLEDDE